MAGTTLPAFDPTTGSTSMYTKLDTRLSGPGTLIVRNVSGTTLIFRFPDGSTERLPAMEGRRFDYDGAFTHIDWIQDSSVVQVPQSYNTVMCEAYDPTQASQIREQYPVSIATLAGQLRVQALPIVPSVSRSGQATLVDSTWSTLVSVSAPGPWYVTNGPATNVNVYLYAVHLALENRNTTAGTNQGETIQLRFVVQDSIGSVQAAELNPPIYETYLQNQVGISSAIDNFQPSEPLADTITVGGGITHLPIRVMLQAQITNEFGGVANVCPFDWAVQFDASINAAQSPILGPQPAGGGLNALLVGGGWTAQVF